MKYLIWLAVLVPSLVSAQYIVGGEDDCTIYTPTHSSGLHLSGKRVTPDDLEKLFENVASPSLSLDWEKGNQRLIEKFLSVSRGKSRRLQLYMKSSAALQNGSLQDEVDEIVGFLMGTGEFTEDLSRFDSSEVSLCLDRNGTASDYKFAALVNGTRNAWPWMICRNAKPGKSVPFTAGADNLSITSMKTSPSVLKQLAYESGLEYSIANVGNNYSSNTLFDKFYRHYLAGTIKTEVWYAGGKLDRYKKLIERLDRLAYSHVPKKCRNDKGQIKEWVGE